MELNRTTTTLKLEGLRCTVIGAGGFIGTNLCLALADAGVKVTGCGRSELPRAALAGRVNWLRADLSDCETLRRAVDGADVVVHLVSTLLPAPSNQDPVRDVQENLAGTLRLLQICRESCVRKVIFSSSGGTVYGPQSVTPIGEHVLPRPICSYGVVKVAIESYLDLYRRLFGLDYVALRIANPFGAHQYPHEQGLISALFGRALKGQLIEIWGDGSVVRDYIFISDVVEAIKAAIALDNPLAPRVYNIGSGVGRSVNEVLDSIATLLNVSLDVSYKPQRAVDVPVNVLDVNLARRYLAWTPDTPWEVALQRSHLWLRDVWL